MKRNLIYLLSLLVVVLIASCGDEGDKLSTERNSLDVAVTGPTEVVGALYADVYVKTNMKSVNTTDVVMGVEYFTISASDDVHRVTVGTDVTSQQLVHLSGLQPGTKYSYRTFVIAGSNYYYGDTRSFTTVDVPVGEYVDLKLPSGTLWATMNIGAKTPESYGAYYSWGETKTKAKYDWENYVYTPDNMKILSNDKDAAFVNNGSAWSMPTVAQFEELRSHCDWKWVTFYGVQGYLLTSKRDPKKEMFLPAGGYQNVSMLCDKGYMGFYWSREAGPANHNAYFLNIKDGDYSVTYGGRLFGQSIRSVLAK